MNLSSLLNNKYIVIVANGDFLSKSLINTITKEKMVLALDGAANKLMQMNIRPDMILGDFDSIEPEVFGIKKTFTDISLQDSPYFSEKNFYIVPAKDQLLTDLSKAILFCDAHDVASIAVICATGGRMDHHEGAVRSLRGHYKKERPLCIHTEQQTLQFAKDELLQVYGNPGDKMGMLAYPDGSITTQGLEFEAQNYKLEFGFHENICNALKATQAVIKVNGEVLVVMPHQFEEYKII